MSDIYEMQDRAMQVANRYRQVGADEGLKDWSARDYASGMTKDLGDLTKLLMIQDGFRADGLDGADLEEKIQHEVGDLMWSVLVISKKLGIDPAEAFGKTMNELEQRFNGVLEK